MTDMREAVKLFAGSCREIAAGCDTWNGTALELEELVDAAMMLAKAANGLLLAQSVQEALEGQRTCGGLGAESLAPPSSASGAS